MLGVHASSIARSDVERLRVVRGVGLCPGGKGSRYSLRSPSRNQALSASSSVVTNRDDVGHTFTIDGTLVNAPLAPHRTYRHGPSTGFLEPGAYQFHCSVHPQMKGTVIEVP